MIKQISIQLPCACAVQIEMLGHRVYMRNVHACKAVVIFIIWLISLIDILATFNRQADKACSRFELWTKPVYGDVRHVEVLWTLTFSFISHMTHSCHTLMWSNCFKIKFEKAISRIPEAELSTLSTWLFQLIRRHWYANLCNESRNQHAWWGKSYHNTQPLFVSTWTDVGVWRNVRQQKYSL